MPLLQSILIWPDRVLLSLLVLLLIAVPFLYAARGPMHALIRSASRAVSNPLRLGARSLGDTAVRLRNRNRQMLFAHGSHERKPTIQPEFERVTPLGYPELTGHPCS